MILSRLARFDRFRLAVCGFHFARFRLFSALVGVSLAFDRFKAFSGRFRLCFCRPALPFIISPLVCVRQPIPQRSFLPYFALLLRLWGCMP